jgi:hypothetical protein
MTWQDLVIEQLADDLVDMTERAVRAEADRDVRRVMADVALGQLARMTAQLRAARVEILRLRGAGRRAHPRREQYAA